MGKRGPKAKKTISELWSPKLAYAVGLLASDGCLARNSYLVDLTSKDKEQLENFSKCIGRKFTIGIKNSGAYNQAYRVQFKNVFFYNFLLSVGLTPAKSKTMGALRIPPGFFFDFLRGSFDGDGSVYSYFDPRWKSSFMFYTSFVSASPDHITWLQEQVAEQLDIYGHITKDKRSSLFQLKYAKADSIKILRRMYWQKNAVCLSRKRLKIEKILRIVGKRL